MMRRSSFLSSGRGEILAILSIAFFGMRGIVTCKRAPLSSAARPHDPFLYRHRARLPRAAMMSPGPLFPCPCLEKGGGSDCAEA